MIDLISQGAQHRWWRSKKKNGFDRRHTMYDMPNLLSWYAALSNKILKSSYKKPKNIKSITVSEEDHFSTGKYKNNSFCTYLEVNITYIILDKFNKKLALWYIYLILIP